MAHHTRVLRRLAASLLADAAAHNGGLSGPAEALDVAVGMLRADLENLVGANGVQALLARAVDLAWRELPRLELSLGRTPLSGGSLDAVMERIPAAEVGAFTHAVLGNLLELLVDFLGEDLGLSSARRVWPGLVPDRLDDPEWKGTV